VDVVAREGGEVNAEKIAGPWITSTNGSAYRADTRYPGDWAFGVWKQDRLVDGAWTFGWAWAKHRSSSGLVATKEEAMTAADAYGVANGWTLA
jgi:hypothetical protein